MKDDKRLKRKVRNSYIVSTVSIMLVLFLLGSVGYLMVAAMKVAQTLQESGRLKLRFAKGVGRDLSVKLTHISEAEGGRVVAVFQGDTYLSELTLLRQQSAEVIRQTTTGIRVPKEALRQNEDGEWGAYCLAGAQVVFKKITILFQTDSFYVAEDTGKNGELTRYDKMVVKAKDIENRKVVS